jgi:hypothetical protein
MADSKHDKPNRRHFYSCCRSSQGGRADIGPPNGLGPIIEFGLVPEKKTVKNRLHFDLRADGSTQSNELRRLLDLGAQRIDVGQTSEATWVVLADPEGNEFCLLSRSVQEVPAGS